MSTTNVALNPKDEDRGWNLHFREEDKQWS